MKSFLADQIAISRLYINSMVFLYKAIPNGHLVSGPGDFQRRMWVGGSWASHWPLLSECTANCNQSMPLNKKYIILLKLPFHVYWKSLYLNTFKFRRYRQTLKILKLAKI